MKKVGIISLGLVLVLLGLVVILFINASGFESKQLSVEPTPSVEIDKDGAARRLSGAIQIPTVSQDNATPDNAPEFETFQTYLKNHYPLVHKHLTQQRLGELSLLYTWEGSDPQLPPLLLLGHQDVVPVQPGTEDNWHHPPYAGEIADGYVWGRGTIDNKNGVLGTLEAIEFMLSRDEQPRRTVMLAFGHDEEIGGADGAQVMAQHLAAENINPWMIIDEGGIVIKEHTMPLASPIALVGIAEKGYLNLALTVKSEGGHSSQPPQDTAVGILAKAITRLEESPFPAELEGVAGNMFDYLGPEMPRGPRLFFANRWLFEPLLIRQMSQDPQTHAMLHTTIAPTMLEASPKPNVLPARARAVINFRVAPSDTVESVTEHVQTVIDDPRVTVEATGTTSSPSPVSPTNGAPFTTLQQTIHQIFPDAVVAPYLVLGGTDSRHYSNLSPHVYRFSPLALKQVDTGRMHGTNERVNIDAYADSIRFYRQLILNTGETSP